MRVNTAPLALGAGISKANANSSSMNYDNTELLAINGTIKINSLNNADIKGANLLAQNIELNTVNNLNIESLQDQANSKSKSLVVSLGASPCLGGSGCTSSASAEQGVSSQSAGVSSSSGSGNFGINYNNSKTDKLWVENQTSIIGTNSVVINTGKNTNLKGAVVANSTNGKIGSDAIDVGNLALNTGSFTYSNIYDHDYQQSSGFGLSTSIGIGGGSGGVGGAANNNSGQTGPRTTSPIINSNLSNPVQNSNFYPNGPTTISVSNSGYEKEQTTLATIGAGNITTGANTTFDRYPLN